MEALAWPPPRVPSNSSKSWMRRDKLSQLRASTYLARQLTHAYQLSERVLSNCIAASSTAGDVNGSSSRGVAGPASELLKRHCERLCLSPCDATGDEGGHAKFRHKGGEPTKAPSWRCKSSSSIRTHSQIHSDSEQIPCNPARKGHSARRLQSYNSSSAVESRIRIVLCGVRPDLGR